MSRLNREDADDINVVHREKFKLGVNVQTLTGATTLGAKAAPVQVLDPGGATRVLTMPTGEEGLVFIIYNSADAAEDLTVKNAAASTLGTIAQAEGALVIYAGGEWKVTMVGTST